jgi:hypothetical protein
MDSNLPRTTIGIKRITKVKLDQNRAPGQCYDGFLCQLISLWEEAHAGKGKYTNIEIASITRKSAPGS